MKRLMNILEGMHQSLVSGDIGLQYRVFVGIFPAVPGNYRTFDSTFECQREFLHLPGFEHPFIISQYDKSKNLFIYVI